MNILGIHCYGHDTAAALVKDGELVAAIEEERLSRNKHDSELPALAVAACLEAGGLSIGDVDLVVLSQNFSRLFKEKYLRLTLDNFPAYNQIFLESFGNMRRISSIVDDLRESIGYYGEIRELHHHLCHIASSYYQSGFPEAACVSVDGLGEIESTVIAAASGNAIKIKGDARYPHSLGLLYSAITDYLGFTRHSAEGTVMALASFGDAKAMIPGSRTSYLEVFRDIAAYDEAMLVKLNLSWLNFPFTRVGWVSDKFLDQFGPRRARDEPVRDHHRNIAAALQQSFEEVYLEIMARARRESGSDNLALAGGCALNCVANGKIMAHAGFRDVYIQPAANDAGCAIGAALLALHAETGEAPARQAVQHTYFGPAFDEAAIEAALQAAGLPYRRAGDVARETAALLADGKVVGWFQGRMEFGPRALGNRSILAEHYAEVFTLSCPSPFMLIATRVQPTWRDRLPAVVHVDETARVQSVSADVNPLYHRLLGAFHELTGVPVLLNTSFNDKGEPIVCTPGDAIASARSTGLDFLVLGPFLVDGQDLRAAAADSAPPPAPELRVPEPVDA